MGGERRADLVLVGLEGLPVGLLHASCKARVRSPLAVPSDEQEVGGCCQAAPGGEQGGLLREAAVGLVAQVQEGVGVVLRSAQRTWRLQANVKWSGAW